MTPRPRSVPMKLTQSTLLEADNLIGPFLVAMVAGIVTPDELVLMWPELDRVVEWAAGDTERYVHVLYELSVLVANEIVILASTLGADPVVTARSAVEQLRDARIAGAAAELA